MIEYRDTVDGVTPESLTGFFVGWPNPPSPAAHLRLLAGSDHVVVAIVSEPGQVVDLAEAHAWASGAAIVPQSTRAFLAGGEQTMQAAREALAYAMDNPDARSAGRAATYRLAGTALLAPVGDPQKIVCIGQNYR